MFLPYFDVFCDLLVDRPTAHTCHIPLDLFEGMCLFRHFLIPKRYFLSRLLLFYFILLLYSFCEKFFIAFSCSKQNNSENTLQNSESLVVMMHNSNCCEDFLQLRHPQVVKNSSEKLLLQEFRVSRLSLAYSEIISQTFSKPRAIINRTKKTSFL